MCTISIIVPVYNAEEYLCECMDSIIGQTYEDWELILVDDGSKDSSGDICDEYSQKDSRIKVFHKTNGGVSSARNHGLEHANGEWIAFIDADDWVDDDYLEKSIVCSKNVDMVTCNHKDENGNSSEIDNVNRTLLLDVDRIDFSSNLSKKLLYFPWGHLYRKGIIKSRKIKFNEDLRLSEDTCFNIEYLMACKTVAIFNENLYVYRTNTGLSKYILNHDELVCHVKALDFVFNSAMTKRNMNLHTFQSNLISILFFYHKDYLQRLEDTSKYKAESKKWTYQDIVSVIWRMDVDFVSKMWYVYIVKKYSMFR